MSLTTQSAGGALTAATLATIKTLAASILPTQGNIFFVCPATGSDSNPGTMEQPLKTLAQALSMATAGQNDVIFLCGQSNTASLTTDYQSAVLTWNKDMVHLIGINAGSFCSPRSRIAPNAAVAGFANLFTLSANGCLIQGIEFFQGAGSNTLSAASTCVTVSGARNVFRNCAISGIGAAGLDYAGSNSLTVTGSENLFQHCYIGLDTIIRSNATYEVSISGTPARTIFEECHFASYTSLTTFRAVSIATTVDRFVKFKNCQFEASANVGGDAVPAGTIGITTMNGQVYMINPALFGYALVASGGNAYVKVVTFQAATTVQGVGQSAAAS